MGCEISQQKWAAAKIAPSLRNDFTAAHPPLQNFLQLRSDPMAHECHFTAKYTRFAATKWLQAFHTLRSIIFAAEMPFGRVFRSCETTIWHTSATLQHPYAHFATAKWAAKIALLSEIHPPLQKCLLVMKWFRSHKVPPVKSPIGCEITILATKRFLSFKMAAKMFLFSPWATKLPFGCEIISQPHSYPLWNPPFAVKMAFWLRNDFPNFKMVVKWFPNFEMGCKNVFLFSFWLPNGCEMTSKLRNDLQKHFVKPREIVKMLTKPRNHASKEESPLTEITHMKPLTPFLTSLNHQSP